MPVTGEVTVFSETVLHVVWLFWTITFSFVAYETMVSAELDFIMNSFSMLFSLSSWKAKEIVILNEWRLLSASIEYISDADWKFTSL